MVGTVLKFEQLNKPLKASNNCSVKEYEDEPESNKSLGIQMLYFFNNFTKLIFDIFLILTIIPISARVCLDI